MLLEEPIRQNMQKALELIWEAKDLLDKSELSDEEFSRVIGALRRADNILGNVQTELCDLRDDN